MVLFIRSRPLRSWRGGNERIRCGIEYEEAGTVQRFLYKAYEASGRTVTGIINAGSEEDARKKLLTRYASVHDVRRQPSFVTSSKDGNLVILESEGEDAEIDERIAKDRAFLKRLSLQAAREEAARHRLRSEISSEIRKSQRKAANRKRPRRKGKRNAIQNRTLRTGQTPPSKKQNPLPSAETPHKLVWKLALSLVRDFINRRPWLRTLLTQIVAWTSGLGAYLLAPQASTLPEQLPTNSGVGHWVVIGCVLVFLLMRLVRHVSVRKPKIVMLPKLQARWLLGTVCVVVFGVAAGFLVRHISDQNKPATAIVTVTKSANAIAADVSTNKERKPTTPSVVNPPVKKPDVQNDETSLQTNLDEWKSQYARLGNLAQEMEQEKTVIVRKLRAIGIFSGKDLGKNAEGRLYADELLEIVQTIREIENKTKSLSFAIAQGESLLRKIDRQRRLQYAGINSEQRNAFTRVRQGIEERLRSSAPENGVGIVLQIEDVLADELTTES